MAKGWRISIFNGVLLAAYFIPAWTLAATKIWISPVRGLYDRANIAPAMFVSDHISVSALYTVRFAWLLALGKLMVAAFFLLFLVQIIRESIRRTASCDEALAFALALGSLISMGSLLAASAVGEMEALRLHACESLLLIGAAIVLIIDAPDSKALSQSGTLMRSLGTKVPAFRDHAAS